MKMPKIFTEIVCFSVEKLLFLIAKVCRCSLVNT